jgi:hypothetical protein
MVKLVLEENKLGLPVSIDLDAVLISHLIPFGAIAFPESA